MTWDKRLFDAGPYRVFWWSGSKWQWWRGFEMWDRLCLGHIYVLYFRPEGPTP